MNWIEKLARGKPKSVERQLDDLARLNLGANWSYRQCQDACATTRDIWLQLCMRYMRNPVADGLVNAPITGERSKTKGRPSQTSFPESIFSQAWEAFQKTAYKLEVSMMALGQDAGVHARHMHENVIQRQEMIGVLLRSDLTYREKLDDVHSIGDRSKKRIEEAVSSPQFATYSR